MTLEQMTVEQMTVEQRLRSAAVVAIALVCAGCSGDAFPFSQAGQFKLNSGVCGVMVRPTDGVPFASSGGELAQLDLAGGRVAKSYPITPGTCRGNFSADGKQLALASNNSVLLATVEPNRIEPKPVVQGNSIRDAALVAGRLLWTVTSSSQGGLHHGPPDGSTQGGITPPVGPGEPARGEHLTTTSDDRTAYFTNPGAGRFHRVEVSKDGAKLTASYAVGQFFSQVAVSRDGRWGLAVGVRQSGSATRQLALVDLQGAKALQWHIGEAEGWVPQLAAFNPADSDEAVVVYSGQGGVVLTRFTLSQRAAEGQLQIPLKGGPVALVYGAGGGRLAVIGSGGDVMVLERD
jgi:hypothetical protein